MATIPTAKQIPLFFSSSSFAVLGASASSNKFGHKLLSWYLSHPPLSVTGINPNTPLIHVASTQHQSVPSLSTLLKEKGISAADLSVSVVTPPSASHEALKEMKKLGIKKVWFQPGAWNTHVVEEGQEGAYEWEAFIFDGENDPECGNEEGWCVLVHGERGIRAAERLKKGQEGKL